MLKTVRAWALALATLSLASVAHATCPNPSLTGLTGKDASQNVQTLATLTQSGQQWPLHLDDAFNGTVYAPLTSDASCFLNVDIQAGSVSLTGSLPSFATTPTVNLGSIGGAATAANQPALNGDGGALAHVTNFPATQPVSGTVTANAGTGTFGTQDGADTGVAAGSAPAKAQLGAVQYNSSAPTLTTGQTVAAQGDVNGNLKVNCVTGCGGGGGGAVTMASGAVAANAYALGAILDLGTGGTLHNDLQTLNTTAGAPAKIDDSSNTEVTDPNNHAMFTEPTTNGRFVQAPVSITTTSATPLVAAQGAGLYTYVTDLDCENSGQYSFTLTVTNSASTSLYTLIVPAGGGWTKSFATPLGGNGQMTANTALSITATQVGGSGQTPSIVCNVQGRVRSN